MARKEAAGTEPGSNSDLGALLARLAELEQRVKKLEAERDDAVARAAALAVAVPPGPPVLKPESAPTAALVAAVPAPVSKAPTPAPAAPPPAPKEEISEEMLAVISAAVAAFLGKRAHVRQIRLVSSEAWAQQGRVSIMASHRWAVQR